jgi:hypothetical protein
LVSLAVRIRASNMATVISFFGHAWRGEWRLQEGPPSTHSGRQHGTYLSLDPRMRRCAPLIFLILGACVGVESGLVYLPEDVASTSLGGCPQWFKARLFEQDGVGLDFFIDPRMPSALRGSLRFDIPKGRSARFLDSRVTIEAPSYSTSLTAELYGCPELHRSTHTCFWDAPRISDQKVVVVTLPPVEINGSRYDVKPIRFSPQRKLVVCWLSA